MKRIRHCLNPRLAEIGQRSIQLEALAEKICQFLPAEFHPHCKVASFSQGNLILTIDCPVWGAQLRYLLPELRNQLRSTGGFYQLSSIKLNVSTPTFKPKEINEDKVKRCKHRPLKALLQHLSEG